ALLLERDQRISGALPELTIGVADAEPLLVQRRLHLADPIPGIGISCAAAVALAMRRVAGLMQTAQVPVAMKAPLAGPARYSLVGRTARRLRPRQIMLAAFLRKRRRRFAPRGMRPVLLAEAETVPPVAVAASQPGSSARATRRQRRSVIVFHRRTDVAT